MSIRIVNWKNFEGKNPNYTEAFEKMCIQLFCREYKISSYDFSQDFNQAGLEIYPVNANGELIGIQCKYCENSDSFYDEAYDSLLTAFKYYQGLSKIIIYSQLKLTRKLSIVGKIRKNDRRKKIEDLCQNNNCKVQFFTTTNFNESLSKNEDIYDYYFSNERVKDMGLDDISLDERLFLNSDSFVDLRLNGEKLSSRINDFYSIKEDDCNIFLIDGKAGSGKTEVLNKIYLLFETKYVKNLDDEKNQIKPIMIRLREVENLDIQIYIDQKLKKYGLTYDGDTKFSYFFDGLDEIFTANLNGYMSYLIRLSKSNKTHSIIFTSRLDSINRSILLNTFPEIKKFKISDLTLEERNEYIEKQSLKEDVDLLKKIVSLNSVVYNEIFSLNILCRHSKKVSEKTTIADLIDLQVESIFAMNSTRIANLNLLNVKTNEIIQILKKVSLKMANDKVIYILYRDFQEIVIAHIKHNNYKMINDIIENIVMMFFDFKDNINTNESILMYKHKRFYEYFLSLYIRENMYENPFILRELGVFSQKSFFINFVVIEELKKARKEQSFYKNTYIKLLLSRIGISYLEQSNSFVDDQYFNEYSDICFFDKHFVESMCMLSKNEIKDSIQDGNLFWSSFLKSNNNFYLLYKYYLTNRIDLIDVYNEEEINKFIESHNEKDVYFLLYNFMKGAITFSKIKNIVIDALATIENIFDADYIDNEVFGAVPFLREILNYLLIYQPQYLIEIIEDARVDDINFNKVVYILLFNENSWVFSTIDECYSNLKESLIKRCDKIKDFKNYICLYAANYLLHKKKNSDQFVLEYIKKKNIDHISTWKDDESLLSILSMSTIDETKYYHEEYKIVSKIKNILFFENDKKKIDVMHEVLRTLDSFTYSWSNFFRMNLSKFLGYFFCFNSFDSSSIKMFVENASNRINKVVLCYEIYLNNVDLFKKTFNISIIEKIYNDVDLDDLDYSDVCQTLVMFSNMLGVFDKNKFYEKISLALNYCVFRPNDSKENLICQIEPLVLYICLKHDIITREEMSDLLKQNLLQYRFSKKALYKSNYPNYLKFLYNELNPEYEFSFGYNDEESEPQDEYPDSTKKSFDEEFLISKNTKIYDTGSFDFWCECVKHLELISDFSFAYEMLDESYFPSFINSSITANYHIIGAFFKYNADIINLFDYIDNSFGAYVFYQILIAYAITGNANAAREMLYSGFKLINCMTFIDEKHYKSQDIKVKLDRKIMFIVQNSDSNDYTDVDYYTAKLYDKDPNLCIVQLEESDPFSCEFTKFWGKTAFKYHFEIKYYNHVITDFYLLNVDGGKCFLPLINDIDCTYEYDSYRYALLYSDKSLVDDYLKQVKLNFERKKDSNNNE